MPWLKRKEENKHTATCFFRVLANVDALQLNLNVALLAKNQNTFKSQVRSLGIQQDHKRIYLNKGEQIAHLLANHQ